MLLKKIFYTILASVLLLASCKTKDEFVPGVTYNGPVQVSFNNYINDDQEFGFYSVGLPIKDSFITTKVVIKLSNTTSPADHDIKIYLAKNDAVVTDYNTVHGTNYSPISVQNAGFDFDLTQPIILRAGQREVAFPIRVNPVRMGSGSPALGLVIANADGAAVSPLQNKLVVTFVARNKYDGRYSVHGTFVDYANPAFSYYGDYLVSLITTGANSDEVFNETLGNYGYIFSNAGSPTYYGNFGLNMTWDPSTDKITAVTNYYGQPSSNGRSANLDPSGANKLNPDHSIDIKYWMDQPSVITPHRAAFNEHWTYIGPR
ncbi:MAG: hypothetical protein C4329_15360 [Chitinophagaceae bacterium]